MPVTKSNSLAILLIVIHRPIKHFTPLLVLSILCLGICIFFSVCKNCFHIKKKTWWQTKNEKLKTKNSVYYFRLWLFYFYFNLRLILCFVLFFWFFVLHFIILNEKPYFLELKWYAGFNKIDRYMVLNLFKIYARGLMFSFFNIVISLK